MAVELRQLLWLRWRLLTRGFSRSKARWVGVVLLFLLVLPWSLGLAGGLFFALYTLPVGAGTVTGEMVLQVGLTLATMVWVGAPLLGFALNDAYDITRLFLYPVSRQRIFLGSLLGSLLDGSTLFLLPALLAALVALALQSPIAGLVALNALALFLLQTLALSQGIVLATQGILKSRKFRDIALVAVPALWMLYQVGNQYFWRSIDGNGWKTLVSGPATHALGLLPSGMAAHAIGAAARGEFARTAGWLVLLGTVTAVTLRVCGALVAKAHDGESVGPAPAPEAQAQSAAPERAGWFDRLPPATAAVVRKERLIFRREPHFRLILINMVFSIGFAAFLVLSRSGGIEAASGQFRAALSDWVLFGGTGLILLQQSSFFYNQFGHDGFAAPTLFGFPARRRDIILGKNLALLSVAIPLNLALALALCLVTRRIEGLLLVGPFMVLSSVVQTSIGNVLSLAFPFRIALRNFRGRQQASGMGAGQSLLYLLVFLATNLLLVPIAAAVLLPRIWIDAVWSALTVPLAAAYAGGLYALSLKLFDPLIAERELWLVERLTQSEQ